MNMEKEIQQILITDIIPNRFQPRLTFDEEALKDLSESIKQHGIIQPLVLRKLGDKYEIIAGERRYKASVIAGRNNVPAIIVNLDDIKSAEVALAENIQRKDLSSIEEAESYQNILKISGMTQTELATRMGKSQSNIANKLRLLELTPEVRKSLLNNEISERHARSLLIVKDSDSQILMLNKIRINRLTVRQTDEEIKKLFISPLPTEKPINEDDIEIIEDFNVIEKNNDIVQEESKVDNQTPNNWPDTNYINSEIDINKMKEQTMDINQQKETPNFDNLLKSNENEGNNINSLEQVPNNQNNSVSSPTPSRRFFSNIEDEPTNMLNDFINPSNQMNSDTSNEVLENKNSSVVLPDSTILESNQNKNINPQNLNSTMINNKMVNNSPDLRSAISTMREKVTEMNNNGYVVEIQEKDLDDNYQIIIKIQK